MSRTCISQRIRLLLLLCPFSCFAQHIPFDTLGFYNHLAENNLQREQITFNNELMQWHKGNIILADSLHLNNAILYYKLNSGDSAYRNLLRVSSDIGFREHSKSLYLSMLILYAKYDEAGIIINTNTTILKNNLLFNDAAISITILKREPLSNDTTQTIFSPRIEAIKKEYEMVPTHSPLLAGVYSAIIPGLGKLYLGYKYQAFTAFVTNALLAGQSIESYARSGPGSVRFILSTSLFSVFYGGNILGSIFQAKKQKHDYLKQIDYEIFDYHNAVVGKLAY